MKLRKKAAVAVAVGAMAAIGVSLVTSSAAHAEVTAPDPILVSSENVKNCGEFDPAGDLDLLADDEDASGNGVTVTLVDVDNDGDTDLDGIEVEVAAGTFVTAIAVKGGNAYNVYIFDPAVQGLETIVGLASPDNASETPAGVSHYVICGGQGEPDDECDEAEADGLYGVAAVARDGEPDECVTPSPSTSASASASASGSLPVTGTTLTAGTMTGIIGAGIALIAAGAALVFLRRRRATAGE
jgi:hypothetical protein